MLIVIGETLPLAIAIAFSPLGIVAVIVMLLSRYPRASSASFVVGWATGIKAVALAGYALAAILPDGGEDAPRRIAGRCHAVIPAGNRAGQRVPAVCHHQRVKAGCLRANDARSAVAHRQGRRAADNRADYARAAVRDCPGAKPIGDRAGRRVAAIGHRERICAGRHCARNPRAGFVVVRPARARELFRAAGDGVCQPVAAV